MSVSTTSTINMNGSSTGYGATGGTEIFNLGGYYNTVKLAGANDTVNVGSGLFDTIDVNSTGFANGVTDTINLGASAFGQVISSHALNSANVSITASGGPNTISLLNHGGNTSVSLGYVGDPALQGAGLGNSVTLNGDATNSVVLASGGSATVAIGSVADGFTSGVSSVSLSGAGNLMTGGDEAFTVANATAVANVVSLGNGADTVTLAGTGNVVTLGNGADVLSFIGGANTAMLGGGADTVNIVGGMARLTFAAGNAGTGETVKLAGGAVNIHGGDENFSVLSSAHAANLAATLGNGSNTISMAYGNAHLVVGTGTANTGHNMVTLSHGGANAVFNGGQDSILLSDSKNLNASKVVLNGTMLGTQLTASGAFDSVSLTQDANATINDTGLNAGLNITLTGDANHGFGTIAITGLAQDDLAQIHLVNAGAYSLTTDDTAVGGITLHFAQGSVDLVGLNAVPAHLFGG